MYLIHPVGVEHPQATQPTSSSLLSNRPLVSLELELGDTLVLGLAINNTLGHRSLPATTPDTDPVNYIPLEDKQRILLFLRCEANSPRVSSKTQKEVYRKGWRITWTNQPTA
jgi:hypothetical protein